MKKVGIAILGLGTVGGGTYEILTSHKNKFAETKGVEFEVISVLEKNEKVLDALNVPKEKRASDIVDIISNDEIDLVVEVIGGTGIAKTFVTQALSAGKTVVTANKELIAKEFDSLNELARKNCAGLYYEASCVGGTPVIRTLFDSMQANNIESLKGIVNGTTNYILTKMTEEGSSYADALKVAQELGFAEADPTSDVDGFDAMYKIAILSSIAFAGKIDLNKIYREGIREIKKEDIDYAKQLGYVIKLLAIAKKVGNEVEVRVHPTLVKTENQLSTVSNSFNALNIVGDSVGDIMLYGRGAGALPTGSAIVSDIIYASKFLDSEHYYLTNSKAYKESNFDFSEDFHSSYYIRMSVQDKAGVLAVVADALASVGISITEVIQKSEGENGCVPLIITTHQATESKIALFKEKAKSYPEIKEIASILRIEK